MNEKINNSKFNASWLFTLLLPLIAGCAWLIYDFNSRPIPDKPNPGYNPKHLSSDQMKAFDPSFGFNRERILGEINVPQAGTRLPTKNNQQSTPQETQYEYEYSNGQSFKKQETQVSENHEPKPNPSSKKVWVVKGLGVK